MIELFKAILSSQVVKRVLLSTTCALFSEIARISGREYMELRKIKKSCKRKT